MKDISLLWLFTSLVFIGMSIPLILEKVPPNRWYGFRVAKTFSSERIWYIANRAAGYDLLWAGVLIAITSAVTRLLVNWLGAVTVNTINFAVFISVLVVAVIHSFLTLNQL